jgi:dienelactone hydrolase
MTKTLLAWFIFCLLIVTTGCPEMKGGDAGPVVAVDAGPVNVVDAGPVVTGPVIEFDPARNVLPFPSNLFLNAATGNLNLPEQCNESAPASDVRIRILNALDGFGTFQAPMQVTFSEAFDEASLTDKVVLYKRASGTTAVEPGTAMTIPVKLVKGTTIRFANQTDIKACTDPLSINTVTIIPLIPLDQKSTYVAAILKGVKTSTGSEFGKSGTWSLLVQDSNPVTLDAQGNVLANRTTFDPSVPAQLAQIQSIDRLYKAHTQALSFLSVKHTRGDITVAWEFNTQTVNDVLDPTVAGSLAAKVDTAPLVNTKTVVPEGVSAEQFLQSKLPSGACSASGGSIPCNLVGDILSAALTANKYQVDVPAKVSTTSTNPNEGGPIPGAFNAPVNAVKANDASIAVLAMVPAAAPPAKGYPVVIFGHGLGGSRTALIAIGSQLAAGGYASVAIDFVAHDSRAVRTSKDAALGCETRQDANGVSRPQPTIDAQCYAPFLSVDFAATRDNIRQSVLDLHELVGALKGCGTTLCGPLKVDATNISYTGISLGGIIGATAVASKPDFHSAVLNVPGVGWLDVLENSQTNAIKCPLVDALIEAKSLVGDKWNPGANSGLCTTDAWKTQPGYRQFALLGRWVLDPADGANFARKLVSRKILIQEVVGDLVVPNVTTNNLGALVGLTSMPADPFPPTAASAAITTNPTADKFVKYTNLPANAGMDFPGNLFAHGSLLRPANASLDGRAGTGRLQTDAITFLFLNKAN